jgi:predicted nucleotide-binding protein
MNKTNSKKPTQAASMPSKASGQRSYVSQSDAPRFTLESALRLAEGLIENFGGKAAAPHLLAQAIDISPTSSNWKRICGAAIAYGLTEGGYNAGQISLTDLGRRIVSPTVEGDDAAARVEAALTPRIAKDFFTRYDRAKFPREDIAANVIAEMGVPKERASDVVSILRKNGEMVGLITGTKTGPFVAMDVVTKPAFEQAVPSTQPATPATTEHAITPPMTEDPELPAPATNRKVFIGHGKDTIIVGQLKDILQFGKFEPVVAEETETKADSVPEKVIGSMRACGAGILHVSPEDILHDSQGKAQPKLNGNVLIEIGAAMALYEGNFILLVEKGTELPSNLQGLYKCEYEGDKLDMEATMKLLKGFNEFGA